MVLIIKLLSTQLFPQWGMYPNLPMNSHFFLSAIICRRNIQNPLRMVCLPKWMESRRGRLTMAMEVVMKWLSRFHKLWWFLIISQTRPKLHVGTNKAMTLCTECVNQLCLCLCLQQCLCPCHLLTNFTLKWAKNILFHAENAISNLCKQTKNYDLTSRSNTSDSFVKEYRYPLIHVLKNILKI